MKTIFTLLAFASLSIIFYACGSKGNNTETGESTKDTVKKITVKHPEWIKDKNIYEVNIRQYTKEGTLKAFQEHLPRLKEMGVDILWLMPIHPIGEKNRKGGLGSYYSVQDYKAVILILEQWKTLKTLLQKLISKICI